MATTATKSTRGKMNKIINRRKKKWLKEKSETDSWADATGMPIDNGIKNIVIALNAAGLVTTASCEGHLGHGISAPWVDIAASDEPEERFIDENKIFQKYADKYGTSLENIKRMTNIPEDIYWKARKECSENPETEEYRQWDKKTQEIGRKAENLVKEFYKDRKVSRTSRLIVRSVADRYQIANGGKDYRQPSRKMSREAKKHLESRLVKYRAEMNCFAEFIKEKYLYDELPTRKK